MHNSTEPGTQENEEIKELKKEIAHDENIRDRAEKLVQEESSEINRLEKKLEELEHPKVIELIVNAEPKEWRKPEISYREVVILAFGSFNDADGAGYSIDYTHGPEGHRSGILDKDQSVPVKNKMRFRVTPANRS